METHSVACYACQSSFDALAASWCSCLVSERTLVCPTCASCFCKAPAVYKRGFWSAAPRALWDRKFSEHHTAFEPKPNPEVDAVVRPLVLVVDDEPDILRTAIQSIESLGYGTIFARNGADGLAVAKQYRPDLVLTDALMPQLDGREMCRQIKADPESRAKVVVMTALYTNLKYQNEGHTQYKVDGYVGKPLEIGKLQELLKKHLG